VDVDTMLAGLDELITPQLAEKQRRLLAGAASVFGAGRRRADDPHQQACPPRDIGRDAVSRMSPRDLIAF
jgi:hypothetical protein